jgi:hypothetical protein
MNDIIAAATDTMTVGRLRRLHELAVLLRLERSSTNASDEGGESADRPSECNQR